MNPVTEWFSAQLVYALGWTLLHSLWQGALVAAVLAMLLLLTRRRAANGRYLLGVGALLCVVAMGIATFAHYFQIVGEALAQVGPAMPSASASSSSAHGQLMQLHGWLNAYMPHIVLVWLLGFSVFLTRYCGAWFYCFRLKNNLSTPATDDWQQRLSGLGHRIDLNRYVELRLTCHLSVPCVIGHLKPVVLLPAALLTRLTQDEVEAILLHELGHIRRNDYLVGLVQSFIKTLYFFNWPVLWICAQIDRERENACDDIAADQCQSRLFYARTLNNFSAITLKGGLVMAATGNQRHLLARVQRLFETSTLNSRPLEGVLASLMLIAAGVFLSIQTQTAEATETYPEIESLDDASVQRLMEDYKSQILTPDQEARLTTTLDPGPDFESLSQAERQAFVQYFERALWEGHYENNAVDDYWKHLSDEEWVDLKRLWFEGGFGHVLGFLEDPDDRFRSFSFTDDEGNESLLKIFHQKRVEMVIPLAAVQSLYQGDERIIGNDKLSLARQPDGRLVILVRLEEGVPDKFSERAIASENKTLDGHWISIVAEPDDPDHVSLYGGSKMYQITIGEHLVEQFLNGEVFKHGNAMAGVRTVASNMLELAYEPDKWRDLAQKQMFYVPPSAVYTPKISEQQLDEKIQTLPSDLVDYLYTEEQLDRWLLYFVAREGRPLGEGSKRVRHLIMQNDRVDFLLEAMEDPDIDIWERAESPVRAHHGNVWVSIIPQSADETESTFDFVVENEPFSQAVAASRSHCEGAEYPDHYGEISEPIFVYGHELTCAQLAEIFQTLENS